MQPTTISILQELATNTKRGQNFTMFTEFSRDDRYPLSDVIEALDFLLQQNLVSPRFPYPGMERISVAINDAGRKTLAEATLVKTEQAASTKQLSA